MTLPATKNDQLVVMEPELQKFVTFGGESGLVVGKEASLGNARIDGAWCKARAGDALGHHHKGRGSRMRRYILRKCFKRNHSINSREKQSNAVKRIPKRTLDLLGARK